MQHALRAAWGKHFPTLKGHSDSKPPISSLLCGFDSLVGAEGGLALILKVGRFTSKRQFSLALFTGKARGKPETATRAVSVAATPEMSGGFHASHPHVWLLDFWGTLNIKNARPLFSLTGDFVFVND